MAFLDRLKSMYEKRNAVEDMDIIQVAKDEVEEEIRIFKEKYPDDCEAFLPIESQIRKDYENYVRVSRETEEPLDYSLNLYISQDKMTAFGCVFAPILGGRHMSVEKLEEDIILEGINFGLCYKDMEQVASERQYFKIFVVARGTYPIAGMDGRIIDYIERHEKFSVEANNEEIVNFDRPEIFYHIKKGEVICRIEPKKEGIDGSNVVGGAIPASEGVPAKIPKGQNTVLSSDSSVLLAGRDGHIFYQDGAFCIESSLIIEGNLDGSVSTLEFMENITIIGDVADGVSITAKGDVMIGGKVGAAEIRAGGNIYIHNGMDGKQQGRLVADGSIKCRILANAKVFAHRNIYADSILQCDVTTPESVYVKGGKGILAGGITRAGKCLEARRIGNKSGRINLLFIGNSKFLMEIERKESRISEIDENLEKISKILARLKNDFAKDKVEASNRLRQQRGLYLAEKKDLTEQIEEIYLDQAGKGNCYVKAESILPHTIVDYLGKKLAIKEPKDNCKIFYDGTLRFV